MGGNRFDVLVRSLTESRRSLLGGVLVVTTGWLGVAGADAKKKRKKAPQPVFNEFGCLDVGQPCRGNSALCCSGVCKGKKPKKGKPDKRVCAAHHASNCSPQRNLCVVDNPPVLSLCNLPAETAFCLVTTGNAPFCGSALGFEPTVHCQSCTKDADCLALGFPPGSACVLHGGRCNSCEATENRACMPPGGPA